MFMGSEKRRTKETGMGRVVERPYWLLNVSVLVRAAHQVGAAVFLASYLFPEIKLPLFYLLLAMVSGIGLAGTEFMRHRQLYREFAGVVTVFKMILLGAAYHGFVQAQAVVLCAFILASVGAHVPKNIRHRILF
jgi:hypothetical protein